MMGKSKKTNAMRLLDRGRVDYKVHEYEVIDGKTDGVSVARTLGLDPKTVFKTLVTKAVSRNHYVFVIPVDEELDLKKAAKAAGEKKIEMIPMKDLLSTTGYVHGGCSPIGMKKPFKTFIHERVMAGDRIICSGGRIGMQVDLKVEELLRVTGAELADVTTT